LIVIQAITFQPAQSKSGSPLFLGHAPTQPIAVSGRTPPLIC
jgi:hypothetical protein